MNDTHISDDQINAFIDNQLDLSEKARVLEAIRTDKIFAERVQAMQNSKDMLVLTYSDISPGDEPSITKPASGTWKMAVAASVMMILTGVLGWFSHDYSQDAISSQMQSIASFNAETSQNENILLHIKDMDEEKIIHVLDTAEQLLKKRGEAKKPLNLEIVANASGLGLLRSNSPYRERIESIKRRHMNVSFLACGIAMENSRLKEGKAVQLLPEAEKINAAIDKILNRIQDGWTYVEG